MVNYLSDTAYMGKYKLYRKNVYIDNYIPKIVDEELWLKVQNLRKKKEKRTTRAVQNSLFSGLLYCGKCNIRMIKMQDNRCKKVVIRYGCDNSYRKKVGSLEFKCTNRTTIREENIESYLLANINELAKNYISKNTIIKIQKPKQDKNKINDLEKKLYKLKDLYLDDLIDKDTYKKDFNLLTDELQKLKQSENSIENRDFSKLENFISQNLVSLYNKLEFEEKRRFWLSIIDRILIIDGKIEDVTFL